MGAIEIAGLVVMGFAAVLIVVAMIPESPMDRVKKFEAECRAQGMNFAEIQAAKAIRIGFAQLRRIASDRCIEKGDIKRAEINDMAGHIAIGIAAAHGKEAAKSFIAWIDSCPDEEILYDDARKARFRTNVESLRARGEWPPKMPAKIDPDIENAFKIVKR